jgi:RHS repeat-associated protein
MQANQTLAGSYKYDPFGRTISASGPYADFNLMRFSSKLLDRAFGIYYFGYRWYDPATQRWLSRDPLGEEGFETARGNSRRRGDFDEIESDEPSMPEISEGMNLYWFVKNRPTMEIDPLGLFAGFGYGNYCGWSRRGPGDPIDAVDAACQKHDNCLATWADACKFKFCNIRFCSDVAKAKCHGDKACKKAKRKILTGCGIIVPIPPFIWM